MHGDGKRRFCDQCQLYVHNFSAMTPGERETLLADRTTRKCVGYVSGQQGLRVHTSTWLLLQRLLRPWRAGVALVVMALAVLSPGSSVAKPAPNPPAQTQMCPPHDDKEFVDYKGGIMSADPLWKRVLFFWRYF